MNETNVTTLPQAENSTSIPGTGLNITTAATMTVAASGLEATTTVTVTVAYCIIFPAALLGNILVIYLVFKLPSMRSFTNMLLVNMSVANLLVTLFAMPYSILYVFLQSLWLSGHLGNVTCKLTHYFYALSIAASIFALLLISLDRYYAVLHPFRRRPLFLRSTKCATLLIWVFSCIFMSPYLYQFRVVQNDMGTSFCTFNWSPLDNVTASRAYFVFVFVLLYSLPLLGIGYAYSLIGKNLWQRRIPGQQTMSNRRVAERSKRKVVRMLIIVVVVFALCWIPAHLMHFMLFFQTETYNSFHPLLIFLFFWICHANSAISPWLFLLMHHNFRQGARMLFNRPSLQQGGSPPSSSTQCTKPLNPLGARQGNLAENRKHATEI